jgi:hypothetical protein
MPRTIMVARGTTGPGVKILEERLMIAGWITLGGRWKSSSTTGGRSANAQRLRRLAQTRVCLLGMRGEPTSAKTA